MAKTITISNLKVTRIFIDVIRRNIIVNYNLVDASGKIWDRGEAIFFYTSPDDSDLANNPNWFVIDASDKPTLVGLVTKITNTLKTRYLA